MQYALLCDIFIIIITYIHIIFESKLFYFTLQYQDFHFASSVIHEIEVKNFENLLI